MAVLAKYDIRGIQAYVFRTNKLREIRAVQDLPEKIVFRALREAANALLNVEMEASVDESKILDRLKSKGIEVLDKAGGNAYVIFESEELYRKISRWMALYILKETYSLKLVYTCVECGVSFYEDYEKLNRKLGKLKSEMPEASRMGAFPICRQDRTTGFPLSGKNRYGEYLTEESLLKLKYAGKKQNSTAENTIDNYILKKGIDSHIAVIHIDGNNMGQRINNIISKADYKNAGTVFRSIQVRDSFAEVCAEMQELVREYQETHPDAGKYLIHAVIQAGDDITYITRADIALSFTKIFLEKISKKYMLNGSDVSEYLISACAGIAYCHSHFPFSDAYELAERCCASAKKCAKQNKSTNGYIGNWIDFEVCGHIRDVDLQQSRKKYGIVGNNELHMRPYCVKHPNYENADYDFDFFENLLRSLNKDNPILNRSRAKALRQAYMDGELAADVFRNAANSRNYTELPPLYRNGKAVLYDPIEIMDLYTDLKGKEDI